MVWDGLGWVGVIWGGLGWVCEWCLSFSEAEKRMLDFAALDIKIDAIKRAHAGKILDQIADFEKRDRAA